MEFLSRLGQNFNRLRFHSVVRLEEGEYHRVTPAPRKLTQIAPEYKKSFEKSGIKDITNTL
jgi:hypothetical protein